MIIVKANLLKMLIKIIIKCDTIKTYNFFIKTIEENMM